MPDNDQEELIVDIPDSGPSVDVEVEPPELISESTDDENPEEHLEYSKKVKRRIDKLTKKAREMERQQAAAVDYARNVQAENTHLRTRVQDLDQGYVAEYGDRVATQADSLSRDLETAIATNDTSAQVDLNKKLSQLAIEEERVRSAKQQQAEYQQQQQQQAQYQQQQAAYQQQHKTLVEEEGFDTESPEYYDEIDKRIKVAFPHKFNGSQSSTEVQRPQQAVASATRSGSSGRKTVRLSPSEVAIAKKLGVPLDQYAKYKR
jgi:hypothetical protein